MNMLVPKYGSWLANYCCYPCMKTHDNSCCTLYIQTWQSLPVSYNIIGVRIGCNAVHEYWIQLCNATVKFDVWHNTWTVSYCKISISLLYCSMLVNSCNNFPVLMAQILLFWLCLRESELHCIVYLVGKVETGLLSCLVPPAHVIWNNCSCSQQVEEQQTSLFFTHHIHRYDAIKRSMDSSLQAKQESQRHHRMCLAAPVSFSSQLVIHRLV
jgi:hypothetical protein